MYLPLKVKIYYYSAPVGVRCIVINPSVCLRVCLSTVREHYLWNRELCPQTSDIPCGRGSVVLRRRCATLCTSGFMDGVTFGRNGRDGETLTAVSVDPSAGFLKKFGWLNHIFG